jgi:hypothetical protein
MKIEFVPLLQIQREIYRRPRSPERFEEYLRVMLNKRRDEVVLPPLCAMNPMGKEHCATLLEAWLALDAEGVAARAVVETAERLGETADVFKIGLVLVDDLMGGGTNRWTTEFGFRSTNAPVSEKAARSSRRGWLAGVLWTSETPAVETAQEAVRLPIYRAAYAQAHGPAGTLRELLAQEGWVMAMSGCAPPALNAAEFARTAEILAPHLNARDVPTLISCLFGDPAALALGYSPLGLNERAGVALALHQAQTGR